MIDMIPAQGGNLQRFPIMWMPTANWLFDDT